MKTRILKFSMIFLSSLTLVVTSCKRDDNDPEPEPVDLCTNGVQDPGEEGIDCGGTCSNACPVNNTLVGELEENTTLDATVSYQLTGILSVPSGVTLTIPAGTTITANGADNTQNYLVVQQGGTLNIQGNAGNPVVMTSASGQPGSWGGVVIAGNASTTEGSNATAEVGGIVYGGSTDNDNSGSINYLVIEYAGAQINSESQFNGLSLYAVGSGTSIENVAIVNGTDDGVEFFGGSVSASNFYLENNEDDAIDWTEGWNGTLDGAYVLNTADFSTAVEADGVNNNPTLNNLTAVSTVGGTALQFKKASGATIAGLTLTGFDTKVELKDPDQGSFTNIQIDGADADDTASYATSALDTNQFAWAGGNSSNVVVLSGSTSSNVTLDATKTYFLSGTYSVESGATLTIPAGTTITADLETGDAVSTYVVIQKGGMIDVQGTASSPVIMTSNANTPGSWGGLVIAGDASTTEGVDATAEVGGIIYGGSNDNDDSGSIDYLVIEYAGAQINSESQFNGLSLYAVGDATSISNVAILNGTDDGVEFFGGTVDASNFYLENNEDDAIDWTEGWNGALSAAYVLHTADFSTVVEADGVNNNPTLENVTAVSTVGGTALQFKKSSGATINGLSLTGYNTQVQLKDPDQGSFDDIVIDGVSSSPDGAYLSSTTNGDDFAWIDGEQNNVNVLTGQLSSDLTLDSSIEYLLDGVLSVEAGATLTIPAGTKITADSGAESTATYVVVQKGGAIDVQGTSNDPVVMTAASASPGSWGGLVIAGDATTTEGVDATAEVGGIIYGGSNDTDSSGAIDYLIIEYAGAQINSESQFNGLSLYAVGSGTSISNVAITKGTDDGVEFFGGTVNASNFYLENNEDDAIDWTEGWNGTLDGAYVVHTADFSTAVEADGVNNNPTLNNLTAISTVGGTALQFKKASGATITGLSLSGYGTNVELKDPSQGSFDDIVIDGASSDPNANYNSSSTGASDFFWAGAESTETFVLPSTVSSDLTLDANIAYLLEGVTSVESGATLTIPAGTRISAASGSEATATYVVVQKGGMIDIQGTASQPVIMTAAAETPGSWGGLVIAGDASTTEGVNATAEVGGITYGGSNDTDSSGSIDYLVIEYAGAQINSESQFNGLSLYAVGSGTMISNIAIVDGTDDGVEFFGGTVNASNFYLENNEDDAIDWTEGWNGELNGAYVLHTAGFSTAVEADGVNNNPTLTNLTAVSTVGGTALQFKKASGATVNGLSLSGYDTNVELKDPTQGSFDDIVIDGNSSQADGAYFSSSTTAADFGWAGAEAPNTSIQLEGVLNSSITLDNNLSYRLSGVLSVQSGVTLTIPAGTTIAAASGAEATATYVVVQKGGMIDVQGSAANPVVMTAEAETPGSWGGLVIAGDATTTEGVDATAEVGGIIYGGSNDTDNSGSIDYLVIEYAGAQINSESQFNGLSLYAVGSGTQITNVAITNGTDDGVEFFGGTVNASNFYLENNEDDAIDWTEGWNGTLAKAYVLHTAGFSTVVEADGVNNNPTVNGLTAVSTVGGTALQFKKASGATMNGVTLNGYDTNVQLKDPSQGSFEDIIIDGIASDPSASYGSSTTKASEFAWAGAEESTSSFILPSMVTSDLTLDASISYILDGVVSVESGATLTIPAGTQITADSGAEATATYMVVQKGGMIDVQGTAAEPVVMTAASSSPGAWGGLVIAGDATTTEGIDATAEVGGIIYGGSNDTDNSGSINYLVIEYAGAQINSESQFNGLTLYAVGSATTISNVAIVNGTDDGVEFFGGTVNASNFYLENNEDDAIDWTEGWNGELNGAYVLHSISGFSTAVEADGVNNNPTLTNLTCVSTTGGTALQFKKASGATINGLSLSGYATQVQLKDPSQGSFEDIVIDGVASDNSATYSSSTTADTNFSWYTGS